MFSGAYEEFNDAIFRHCYFRISDRERAKELTQEAFMRIWEYLDGDRPVDNVRALLYRIANNLIIDEYRKKKPISLDALGEKGFDPPAEERMPLGTIMEVKEIMPILDTLEVKYKEVFIMRYIDDLSIKEIAEIIDEQENNVSLRIHRATNQIKKIIENHE